MAAEIVHEEVRGRKGDSRLQRTLEYNNEKMAPKVGLEPTTDRLTADCSTIELLWNPKSAWNVRLTLGSVKHRPGEIFAARTSRSFSRDRNRSLLLQQAKITVSGRLAIDVVQFSAREVDPAD